jgi:hypothetical protein
LRAFDVPGEPVAYVVGEDLAIRAFDAKPDAFVLYAIDWARVAEAFRAALALEPTRVTGVPEALLPLGELPAGARTVVVFSLVRAVSEAEVVPLLRDLRRACGRATPALLVPRGRSLGGAFAEVEVTPAEQLAVADVAWIVGAVAEACGLADEVDLSRFATEAVPLVLSVKRGEAWYGQVRLLLTENQLAMLFALAKTTEWMTAIELGKKISPAADYPDQVLRKARLTLEERLKASFAEAGVPMPKGLAAKLVVVDRRKGYRLGVAATVR